MVEFSLLILSVVSNIARASLKKGMAVVPVFLIDYILGHKIGSLLMKTIQNEFPIIFQPKISNRPL